MNNNIDKTRSTFQRKINALQKKMADVTCALKKRKQYTRNADTFIQMLLQSGRTTKEELNQYFKPIKIDQ
jgi:hypothetical protein